MVVPYGIDEQESPTSTKGKPVRPEIILTIDCLLRLPGATIPKACGFEAATRLSPIRIGWQPHPDYRLSAAGGLTYKDDMHPGITVKRIKHWELDEIIV